MADKIMELWWNTATFASDFLQEKNHQEWFFLQKSLFFFCKRKSFLFCLEKKAAFFFIKVILLDMKVTNILEENNA